MRGRNRGGGGEREWEIRIDTRDECSTDKSEGGETRDNAELW